MMESIMDPKIREIMAQLGSRVAGTSPKTAPGSKGDGKKLTAPQSFDEFLAAEHLSEWPQRITSENPFDLDEERQLLGGKEDILKELKDATPVDLKFIKTLEDRLQGLEDRLNVFADQLVIRPETSSALVPIEAHKENAEDHAVIADAEPLSVMDKTMALVAENKAFLTDVPESNMLLVHPSRKGKKTVDIRESVKESHKRGVEHCVFPGLRSSELTELPCNIEAPQILNRVTKAQDFNPGFKKFWKKIFQSEASIAIMQDSFWWFFLKNFGYSRNEKEKKRARDRLFDRIADSFVALFTSINPEVKDKFFAVYADCLAQSVFATFLEAFPESDRYFQDQFKQNLISTISEWVTGVKPPPDSWRKWSVSRLEPRTHKMAEENPSQAAKSLMDITSSSKDARYNLEIDDFTKMVKRLGEPSNSRLGTATHGVTVTREITSNLNTATTSMATTTLGGAALTMSRQAQCGTPRRPPVESHPIGPGPSLGRVLFNLQGQSPLVSHYLEMRQLKEKGQAGRRVRRTEIKKPLPVDKKTYRELINETVTYSDTLSKEYQKICDQTNQEILKIERQQRDMNREIEKLKRELTFSRNWTDIKIMSERILDKREQEAELLKASSKNNKNQQPQQQTDIDEEDRHDHYID